MLEQRNAEAQPGMAVMEAERAAWLGPSALLLVGAFSCPDAATPSASVLDSGQTLGAEATALVGDGAGALVVTSPGLQAALRDGAALALEEDGVTTVLEWDDVAALATDLQTVVRQSFAPLDSGGRQAVVEFLAHVTAAVPPSERAALSERLHTTREALRERLPACVISETQPRGLHVDRILMVDDSSLYVEGWMHDEDAAVTRVTAVSPEGSRVEILERMYRFPRSDVASFFAPDGTQARTKHGFLCFIELDAPSLPADGWLLEMESSDGAAVEVPGTPVTRDTITVRDAVLNGPELNRLPDDELMEHHVYPAVTRLQAQIGEPRIEQVVQFGTPPAVAEVSIVIPLYRRLDHLEMQLSEFVRDPEISKADLIYVLDSPEQVDELLDSAAQLTPLYKVPFRVAVLDQNSGFAGANNAGASIAHGRLLLLLNSDILPDRPGWLSRMAKFYDSVPHIGALGAKLLYEDDSIQHAGMYFRQAPGSSVWHDAHYYKGMHRSLPAANEPRSVPLVSGACLMIDRTLYQQLGGLRSIYVRGDYEDSDLCLQLMDSGRENWYLPDVELYHLEGQSYSVSADQTGERYTANRYNAWVHSHLWHDRIEQIMRQHRGRDGR